MTDIKKDTPLTARNTQLSTSPALLFLAFGIMILTSLGLGGVSIQQSSHAHENLEVVIGEMGIKLNLLKIMHSTARERSIDLYMMVTETDPFERDKAYMQFNRNAATFSQAYNKFKAMKLSLQEYELLEKQATAANYTVPIQRQVAQLAWEGKLKEARTLMTSRTIQAQNKVIEHITQLQQLQLSSISEIEIMAEASSQQARTILYALTMLTLLLGISIAFYTTRRICRAEKKLTKEKELGLVTLQSVGDAIITTDNTGHIQFMNPVAEHLTGYSCDQAIDKPLADIFTLISETDHLETENPVNTALNEHMIISLTEDIVLRRKDDKEFAIELTAAPIMDDNHDVFGAILTFHDVTEMRSMSYKLSYQATHDSLTGLVNRREFERRLEQTIQNARNEKSSHALCYLDLDQFKVVNDTAGHAAGDELLKQLALKLSPLLRKSDVLARLGGDEFGILLEGCSEEQAYKIADTMRLTIQETRFPWGNNTFNIGVSIGLVPINAESGGITDILSAADSACYSAKEKGRDQIQVYRENDHEYTQRKTEMRWVQDIKKALEIGSFSLFCQPIVGLKENNHQQKFYELLIRLKNEKGELTPPMAFLPAAERYNLMQDIDKWVVKNALETINQHCCNAEFEQLLLSINLSGHSVGNKKFHDYVYHEIQNSRCKPEHLCFEITETAIISNMSMAIKFIHSLKELGCKFSLDDFGSGLSSFTYLKNMPVDFLKIDGTFVRNICHDKTDYAFVEAIHRIGTVMNIATIAEYVENEETLKLLKECGIDYAQGFHTGRPVDINTVFGSLEKSTCCPSL